MAVEPDGRKDLEARLERACRNGVDPSRLHGLVDRSQLDDVTRKRLHAMIDQTAPAPAQPTPDTGGVVVPIRGTIQPQNPDAEQDVLGAMMLAPAAIDTAAEILTPDDFYLQSHATIYQACLNLHMEGEPVDLVTVVGRLERDGLLDKAGGPARLAQFRTVVPAPGNVAHYAHIVKDLATRRALIAAGQRISQLGFDPDGNTSRELVDQAGAAVYDLETGRDTSRITTLLEPLRSVYKHAADRSEQGGYTVGTPTGIPSLDKATAGFEPGNLILLAARPSMGKTALAVCVAKNIAATEQPVAFFSLEMSKDEIARRIISIEARIPGHQVRTGKCSPDDWQRAAAAVSRLEKLPFYIDDARGTGLLELRTKIRQLKRQNPDLALVIIDYLQLMNPPTNGGRMTRNDEVSAISRGLKILAGDFNTPILALSQLNRSLETRVEKRPQLSDLRDSGSLEQDADLVLFLYRDHVYKDESASNEAELILAKQRNGPLTTVPLYWHQHYASFTERLVTAHG